MRVVKSEVCSNFVDKLKDAIILSNLQYFISGVGVVCNLPLYSLDKIDTKIEIIDPETFDIFYSNYSTRIVLKNAKLNEEKLYFFGHGEDFVIFYRDLKILLVYTYGQHEPDVIITKNDEMVKRVICNSNMRNYILYESYISFDYGVNFITMNIEKQYENFLVLSDEKNLKSPFSRGIINIENSLFIYGYFDNKIRSLENLKIDEKFDSLILRMCLSERVSLKSVERFQKYLDDLMAELISKN